MAALEIETKKQRRDLWIPKTRVVVHGGFSIRQDRRKIKLVHIGQQQGRWLANTAPGMIDQCGSPRRGLLSQARAWAPEVEPIHMAGWTALTGHYPFQVKAERCSHEPGEWKACQIHQVGILHPGGFLKKGGGLVNQLFPFHAGGQCLCDLCSGLAPFGYRAAAGDFGG